MAEISLVDVSMRDGNQSLWGATGLNTAQMLQIAGQTDRVGFRAIDFTSSSHMAVAVRYFQNNPWERIRRVAAAMPRTPLQFITTGLRFIAWQQADPEFMRIVYRRLQANGIRRFVMLDPMHDADAVIEAARLVREEGDAEIMGALTFTLSDVHTDQFYADFARKICTSPDIDLIYIKDPGGLLSPERVRTLAPAVKAAIGNRPLEIHAHCTIGYGPLASLAAADLGVIDAVHVGIGPLGEGSSLPEAGRMVANLRNAGHSVAVDDAMLSSVSDYWWRLARAEGLPAGAPQAFDSSFLRHQIAGGVMTTTRRQLEELKLGDRFDAVVAETEQVRAELGHPIMVTPFPQMVMSQALFNVIGERRYAQVSDQVLRYVMGKFGRPTSAIDPAVEAAILDRPRAREIEGEATFPAYADLRRKFGVHMDDEEFLLRAVMPEDQVDAMLSAGRSRATYTPEAAPLLALLRQLAARPDARDIVVERPGLRIALHGGAHAPDLLDRLSRARGFIFDMDGTIALGDAASGGHKALAGAVDLLAVLRKKGVPFRVFTNGTAKAPAHYAASLRKAGFDLADDEMMTPSSSAAIWFKKQGINRVRVLGNEGVSAPLQALGIDTIGASEKASGVEAVYTGWFREFASPDLEAACDSIWNGARLTTASHVPFFATATGRGIGSSFAINKMISAMTGKQAKVLGKPSRTAFDAALAAMGLPRSAAADVVVFGDDPALEMRMARGAGAMGVGLTTGLMRRDRVSALAAAEQPHALLDDLSGLAAALA